MARSILPLIAFLTFSHAAPAQIGAPSLYGAWITDAGVCMELDPQSDYMVFAPRSFGDADFRYRVRKDQLTIKSCCDTRLFFFSKRLPCVYHIDRLTQDELVLSPIKCDADDVLEALGTLGTVVFHRMQEPCR